MTTEVLTRPFYVAHLDLFACAPDYQQQCDESVQWMANLGLLDQCGSQLLDNRILYISAYFSVAPGVLEVFVLPSLYVPRYPKAFFSHVKWWLGFLLAQPGVHRLQTWGQDTEQSRRWLSRLGFQQEGLLYCYGKDRQNTLIWGMVKDASDSR